MSQGTSADVISITLPPTGKMSDVIRLTTAAVASRTGLTIDQTDDLNTALDELSRLHHADAVKGIADFHVEYYIYPDRLEVVTTGLGNMLKDESDEINRYSRFILESVCDEYENESAEKDGQTIKIIKYISR